MPNLTSIFLITDVKLAMLNAYFVVVNLGWLNNKGDLKNG